jgi:hypothetical protein
MSAQVFLSVAGSSLEYARVLRRALEGRNISAFLYEKDIPPGTIFPEEITHSLLEANLVVIFLDNQYLKRWWCVREFIAAVAPFRAVSLREIRPHDERRRAVEHLVIVLPPGLRSYRSGQRWWRHLVGNTPVSTESSDSRRSDGKPRGTIASDFQKILDHLPPPLQDINWPHADQTEKIADLVAKRLAVRRSISQRLQNMGILDEVVSELTAKHIALPGADRADTVARNFRYGPYLPQAQGDAFYGRKDELWLIHHTLCTARGAAAGQGVPVVLRGVAGVGKSQLAAEYLHRYASRHYAGGCFWLNAAVEPERQLREILESLGGARAAAGERQPEEFIKERLRASLEELAAQNPVLFIVDGIRDPADADVAGWIPTAAGVSALITSPIEADKVSLMNCCCTPCKSSRRRSCSAATCRSDAPPPAGEKSLSGSAVFRSFCWL